MNKLFLVIITGATLIFSACKHKPAGIKTGDGYFISTQSETDERVKALGMDQPSENASYVLDKTKLVIPPGDQPKGDEFKPDADREWIVDISLPANAPPFDKDELNKIFDVNWRKAYPATTLYGHLLDKKIWTIVAGGKETEKYDSLKLSIDLVQIYDTQANDPAPANQDAGLAALHEKFKASPAIIKPAQPLAEAVKKAKGLIAIKHSFNFDEVVFLKADHTFKGMDAWDALQSVGLKWGDGDLFHWGNFRSDYGDEALFTVSTDTDPGYFLPEEIKAGRMNPADLVFDYSIPRSADPEHVFDAMLNAVKYCQKRLGGKILNKQGLPLNEAEARADIKAVADAMKARGLIPGSVKVLTLF